MRHRHPHYCEDCQAERTHEITADVIETHGVRAVQIAPCTEPYESLCAAHEAARAAESVAGRLVREILGPGAFAVAVAVA